MRDPFLGRGEPVAPVDLGVQVLLPGRAAAQPGQRAGVAAQPVGDLAQGERSDSGGGEFDPQRQPVHRDTDSRDRRAVRSVQRDRLAPRRHPLAEQRDGGACRQRGRLVADGEGERIERVDRLAVDTQRLAARGQHRDRRGHVDEGLDGGRGAVDDLLAVVEHEQHRPVGEHVTQSVEGRASRTGVEPEGGGEARGDPVGRVGVAVVDRGQVHEPHPVREEGAHVVGDLDREPGLAAATGTDERDDPVRREPGGEVAALGVAADEPGAAPGEVHFDDARRGRDDRRRGGRNQRRVVGEDLLVQPAQCRPRLDTEFVGENAAQLVERRECRLLAARGVERPQPQLPQRLEVGVLGDQRHQVRDGTVGVAGGQQGGQAVLGHDDAHLGEPAADRVQPPGVRDAVIRRAAPAAQGVVGDPQRVGRVRGGVGRRRGRSEHVRVDGVRRHGQPVALLIAPHQRRGPGRTSRLEYPAQPPEQ